MRVTSPWFLVIFFAIFTALAYAASNIVGHFGNAESGLQAFYVQGFAKTLVYAASFFAFCAAVSIAYACSAALRSTTTRIWKHMERHLYTGLMRYSALSFFSAAVVLFILNAPGILHGSFLIDDYEMYAIATQKSLWQLVWTPINEHIIPLFWLELKSLFYFVGTNAPILNLPLYGAATVAVGAAGVLLRRLGFGISALMMFLVVFASTTVVSHQLYGFYAVAPYFQVLAVFTLSLLFFVHARKSARFSILYFILSITLLIASLLIESGGIWTPLAFVLFAISYHLEGSGNTSITSVLAAIKKEKIILVLSFCITALYLGYLTAIPYFSNEPFYGPGRLPISAATIYELYKVLTAGVLSSLFVPRLGLIMSQPRFESIEALWHIVMFTLFSGASLAAWWTYAHSGVRARVWSTYCILLTLGTSLLVAIARPSSHSISFYRDQNLLFPLFFFALFVVIALHEWVRAAQNESTKVFRIYVTIALCSTVFASQMVFSFYKEQYLNDNTFNRELIGRMRETLLPALNELTTGDTPLFIPSLGGNFLGNSSYQLPDLSEFSYFLGITNVMWILPGKSAATSSSPLFAEALQRDTRLREWYLTEGEVGEICTNVLVGKDPQSITAGETRVVAKNVDTAKTNRLLFDITAQDAPEKIFISIAFENKFHAEGSLGMVRLDQYTKQVHTNERRYACMVNLNEIPAFALSSSVRTISITITTPGNYLLNTVRLLKNDEILPSDTQ